MKKTILTFVTALLCAVFMFSNSVFAQNEPVEQKKITYNFINEYGFFLGKYVGFTSVFVNGILIKNTDAIGIGVGYGINTGSFQEVPLFLNYRHYFNRGRKLTPLINIGVGTSFHFWDDYHTGSIPVYVNGNIDHYEYNEFVEHMHGFGLYSTIASGFTVKAFSFTAGLFFRTFPREKEFSGGIEVKVGYTF